MKLKLRQTNEARQVLEIIKTIVELGNTDESQSEIWTKHSDLKKHMRGNHRSVCGKANTKDLKSKNPDAEKALAVISAIIEARSSRRVYEPAVKALEVLELSGETK